MDDCYTIRQAKPDDAPHLSELALRSKAHWQYANSVIEASRDVLTITPHDVQKRHFYVLEDHHQHQLIGFYGFADLEDGAVDLEFLFIAPEAIGQGYGTFLWHHAVETARDLGFQEMFIDSEPGAEPFYKNMGAVRIGQCESPVQPGQMLPLLHYSLG